jgi:hypothetical protein
MGPVRNPDGTREEPGTLTQGGALFSLVPLMWESNPKLQGAWCKTKTQPSPSRSAANGMSAAQNLLCFARREDACVVWLTRAEPKRSGSRSCAEKVLRREF